MDIPIKYLIVFDFDETLSNKHLYKQYTDAKGKPKMDEFEKDFGSNPKRLQDEYFNDFEKMKELFNAMIQNGFKLCIASFGHQLMLERVIELTFGYTIFNKEDIVGTNGITSLAQYEKCQPISKYKYKNRDGQIIEPKVCKTHIILKFMQRYNVPADKTLFLDDDPINVMEARQILPKQNSIVVEKGSVMPIDIANAVKMVDAELSQKLRGVVLKQDKPADPEPVVPDFMTFTGGKKVANRRRSRRAPSRGSKGTKRSSRKGSRRNRKRTRKASNKRSNKKSSKKDSLKRKSRKRGTSRRKK